MMGRLEDDFEQKMEEKAYHDLMYALRWPLAILLFIAVILNGVVFGPAIGESWGIIQHEAQTNENEHKSRNTNDSNS